MPLLFFRDKDLSFLIAGSRDGSLALTRATYSSAPRAVVLPEALSSYLGRTRQDRRAAKGIGLRAELQGESQ